MTITDAQRRELNYLWETLHLLRHEIILPLSVAQALHDALVTLAPYRNRFHPPEPQ